MDDCLMSGGRVISGIARARRASEAYLSLHVDSFQVRIRDLEGMTATREGYIQEDIARSVA